MAKVSAKTASDILAADRDIIAKEFASFGRYTKKADVVAALVRQAVNPETFNGIRVAAAAAHVQMTLNCTIEIARKCVDGTFANADAKKSDKTKRDADQERAVTNAKSAWSYFLRVNEIETANKAKATKKPATRTPGAQAPAKTETPAPKALDELVKSTTVKPAEDFAGVLQQFQVGSALFGKATNASAKLLNGERGSALRALAKHVADELKRIAAMKD